ncbi:hypothetical protein [Macrococcoides caseolyticum]|uniref:hypothetical protein n=1 Tax=Macrococcoides caseolyticum TaxID=69966 RepID=UPI001AA0A14A|nr:hypothetical protein [Macrococcus caseolyticus]
MLSEMLEKVSNKKNFTNLQQYMDFAAYFLEYIQENQQATIVSQNNNLYKFFQYGEEVDYRVTRPFNSEILYSIEEFESNKNKLLYDLQQIRKYRDNAAISDRTIINRTIYTIQQSIGFGLDALPASKTNTARKLAGDLFEKLILELFVEIGINARSGVIKVPIIENNNKVVDMNYQHDLIIEKEEEEYPRLIGSIKTTSKDRIAKIFTDKYIYNKIAEKEIPHIAIFLHDVQRKSYRNENNFGVSYTFLTGTFKGLTIKLNPLDGVYYFDMIPLMTKDKFLSQHINTFDKLICKDIWEII